MQAFNIAVMSPSSSKDVVAILTVYAESVKKALERCKNDNDMQGARFYPAGAGRNHEH
jgi:dihydroorotase